MPKQRFSDEDHSTCPLLWKLRVMSAISKPTKQPWKLAWEMLGNCNNSQKSQGKTERKKPHGNASHTSKNCDISVNLAPEARIIQAVENANLILQCGLRRSAASAAGWGLRWKDSLECGTDTVLCISCRLTVIWSRRRMVQKSPLFFLSAQT